MKEEENENSFFDLSFEENQDCFAIDFTERNQWNLFDTFFESLD